MRIFGYDITKASSDSGRNTNVALDITSSSWERNQGTVGHENYEELVKQYKNWVYVGVFKNSVAVARYPLKLYARKKNKETKIISKHRDVDSSFYKFLENTSHLRKFTIDTDAIVEITEHPLLDLLNKVNPQMNKFDLFSKTDMFLELAGNAYWYLVLNQLGLPVQIWPVSPVNMKINVLETASKTGDFISGYTFKSGLNTIQFKPEEIIHFSFPSPYSNIYGMGPLAAGQDSIIFDHTSREYENILIKNQCRPDVVLQTDQPITDVQAKSFLARLRMSFAGKKGLGKWMLLDRGLKAVPLNLPLREMGFIQGRKASKEEIAGLLGVPVSKLTTEDVNLANASIGEVQYIRDTIAPRLTFIEEKLNEALVPKYDENLFLTYGDVIPMDKTYRLMELEKHLTTQYSTINEERKIDGKEPVEWGDKPIALQQQEQMGTEGNPFESNEIPQAGSENTPPKKETKKHWIDAEEEKQEVIDEIVYRVQRKLAM